MRLLIYTAFVCSIILTSCEIDALLSDNDKTPQQIHIALAGKDGDNNSNYMSVTWQTVDNTATSVKYGTTTTVYDSEQSGLSSTYYSTYDHHAKIGPLIPSTKYYYVVGNEVDGWSSEHSFTSAPLSSAVRGNFSFAVFADLGVVNGEYTNDFLKSIKDDIALVWHGGDVGYADDSFTHFGCFVEFCYEDAFNQYMANIEPWASQIPYMVMPGNHEADCHDPNCLLSSSKREKLSNFTAFNNRFDMPSSESGGTLNMHYSFNYGNVHFISIDTETGYPGAAEETRYVLPCGGFADQLSWLENDLIEANRDREVRPWIFVAGHHPMYQGAVINTEFQSAIENLFYKYGVDMYFSGHVHSYERNYPVYNGVVDANMYINPLATTHLLIGGAGNDEMKDAQLSKMGPVSSVHLGTDLFLESDENGPWTVVTDKDGHVGVGKVTIIDDSNLKFEYIRTSTQEVFDTVTLTRDHTIYYQKY